MTSELPPFDPEWLAIEQMMGGRQTLPAEPVDQARARFEAIFQGIAPFLPPPTAAVTTTDLEVPASKQKVRIYKPTVQSAGPLPVGLYIHSGGWYSGSIDAEDFLCRNVAENSNIILYSSEYRLAPENPFPAGPKDVFAAYEFMHQTASEHGGDPKKLFVMGGSAGGNLAAAVALKYATNTDLAAKGACIFVLGACDPAALPEEYKSRYTPELYSDSPMIGNELMTQARDWYNAPPADPLASVLLHPDIKHLPPLYIAACTKDPTHQEVLFFHEECKKQSVKADLVEWVGMPHFFWAIPMMSKSQEFMKVWNEKLRAFITSAT